MPLTLLTLPDGEGERRRKSHTVGDGACDVPSMLFHPALGASVGNDLCVVPSLRGRKMLFQLSRGKTLKNEFLKCGEKIWKNFYPEL